MPSTSTFAASTPLFLGKQRVAGLPVRCTSRLRLGSPQRASWLRSPRLFATAEFEEALILLDDATEQSSSGSGSNVKRVKAGSAEVEFFTGTAGTLEETRLPTVVNDLVGCFIETSGVTGAAFGTTEVIDYDKDDFDLSQGNP